MKKAAKLFIPMILIFLSLAICWWSYTEFRKRRTQSKEEAEQIRSVEVKEYRGDRLSSINDFVENSIKGPQHINKQTYRLQITGLVEKQSLYTYDEVIKKHKSYQKVVRLNCVEGWSVNILWKGMLVSDLLDKVDVKPGADTIVFYAQDGYSTSFPLSYMTDNPIIMAYEMNGVTIPEERGFPFVLVAEKKWGYKWIKWITKIEVSDDPSYQGFWESRGYSNTGDLDEDFSD